MNGGGNCYVVRIGEDGSENGVSPKALVAAGPYAELGRVTISAIDPVTPAGEYSVEIAEATGEKSQRGHVQGHREARR